ncbi:hypothetical protein ACQEU8_02410 [Streptomyces sp. CA-250714]|uniref:hypothetical protein n=1 Tax=Streptomyces sp. CA-250714 TaxID=3240060 RepID=UPI003D92168C
MSAWGEVVAAQRDDEWLNTCFDAMQEIQREARRRAFAEAADMAGKQRYSSPQMESLERKLRHLSDYA